MVSLPNLPHDVELIARLKSGDEAAFSAMISAWAPALHRLARSFVKSDALAEEVVQEAWMGVVKGLSGFEARSSLKTWVFTILVNRSRTRGVREARTVPMSALGSDEHGPMDVERFTAQGTWAEPPFVWRAPSAHRVVETRQAMEVLREAMELLPGRQRQVVTLRDIEGLEPADVCDVLHISESNQRVLLHRGRSRLRAALDLHHGPALGAARSPSGPPPRRPPRTRC